MLTAGCRAPARLAATLTALGLVVASPSAADTFRPTRFDDPPPDRCRPADCSLREALRRAANHAGADEVVLGRGTYEMEIPGTPGPGIESGDYELSGAGALTIAGEGPRGTRIDANRLDRVFVVFGSVRFERLTVKGGSATANPVDPSDVGGGIKALGSKLVLENVAVRRNDAELGGGIFSLVPKLVVRKSTIAGNEASEGGGIDLRGTVDPPKTLIRASTISGNFAGKGGGVLADGRGPGNLDPPADPGLDVLNSTIAENSVTGSGGGVMADNGANAVLDNTTVAYNAADSDNAGGGDGGGVRHAGQGAPIALGDSILAANSVGSTGVGNQCAGDFNEAEGAIIQSEPGSACLVGSGAHALVGNAKLGPLQGNGGPTETVALRTGSPAIGFGDECPSTDQRGVRRPNENCDSGAFERTRP